MHLMANQIESIDFTINWKEIGRHPGGKLYKQNFANTIYKARTGQAPPTSKDAPEQVCQDFKAFKSRHQLTVRLCNYLQELYSKVCNHFDLTYSYVDQKHIIVRSICAVRLDVGCEPDWPVFVNILCSDNPFMCITAATPCDHRCL